MTDATLDTTAVRPAVRLERYLPDPPPVVWQAITDRAQLKEWFPCDVIVEGGRWEVGAAITFPFPQQVIEMTLTGTVLAVDEPKLLSYTWGDDEILRFELLSRGGGHPPGAQRPAAGELGGAQRRRLGRLPGPAGRPARRQGRVAPPVRRLLRPVRAGHRPAGRPARRVQGRPLTTVLTPAGA